VVTTQPPPARRRGLRAVQSAPALSIAIRASWACSRSIWWMGAAESPVAGITQIQKRAGAAAIAQQAAARSRFRCRRTIRSPAGGRTSTVVADRGPARRAGTLDTTSPRRRRGSRRAGAPGRLLAGAVALAWMCKRGEGEAEGGPQQGARLLPPGDPVQQNQTHAVRKRAREPGRDEGGRPAAARSAADQVRCSGPY